MIPSYPQVKTAIEQAQRIIVLSPGNIDGDCMGANVVLEDVLRHMGKQVEHVCFRPVPAKYDFYPFRERILPAPTFDRVDLVMVTDTAETQLLALPPEWKWLLTGDHAVMNIDHHVSNNHWGTINVVEEVCSASYIVYNILRYLGVEMTSEYATALLAGIYFDTGGLMHNNSTPEVFRVAGALLQAQPNLAAITDAFFRRATVPQLRLWGKVFDKAQMTKDGVLMSAITPTDFEACAATKDDLDGAVEFLNYVPEKKFSFLMYDTGEGKVKGSFRTQDPQVDVNAVAQQFGGGGHTMAAGFMVPGGIEEEVRWRIKE